MIFIDTKVPDFFRKCHFSKNEVPFEPFVSNWISKYLMKSHFIKDNLVTPDEGIKDFLEAKIILSFQQTQRLSFLIPASSNYYVFVDKAFNYSEHPKSINMNSLADSFIDSPIKYPDTWIDLLDGYFYSSNGIERASRIAFDGLKIILQRHGITDFISALSKSSITEDYLSQIDKNDSTAELELYDKWVIHNKNLLLTTFETELSITEKNPYK